MPIEYTDEELSTKIESTRNSLTTDRLDMSFGEIMSMYEKDEIIINPEFQRLFRWSEYQKSRFIETILLGIPIPPIFVAEDKNGKWELVDGLQRLSTVLSFFGILKGDVNKNKWSMIEGDLIKEIDGYNVDNLPMKFLLNIKRSTCRIEIIRWNSDYDMRFELFNRLNTGGSPLTNMEIRNCIYRGTSSKFNNFLKELAYSENFVNLVSPTQKQKNELYLEELVLRFLSLYKNRRVIKNSIDQHMTDYMKQSVPDEKYCYDKLRKIFNDSVLLLRNVGNNVFKSKENDFVTGYFDIIMIGVAENFSKVKDLNSDQINSLIESKIKSSQKVKSMSGRGANSKQRVLNRFKIADDVFGKI
nr:DUF262 domain-containing protein [uncultured Desulfobacter sp.]